MIGLLDVAMSRTIEDAEKTWTAADLAERFGPIPIERIRHDPHPGSATEQDVVDIHDHEDRLYELVDGVLVEKTVGTYESYLAMLLGRLLGNFVADNDLGIVLGADGIVRLAPGLVRIPDVAFISWERLPGRRVPRTPIADLIPDLVVEVLSKSNTVREMTDKLSDYFGAGVRQVWYIDPEASEVRVFDAPDKSRVLGENATLEVGALLPGFALPLQILFADPAE
jgi:Uma2 family endonuclease